MRNKETITRSLVVKKNIIYTFITRIFSILVNFAYVPLLIKVLDKENYGIWLTLTSVVGWIALMDIGLGNGLRNELTELIAQHKIKRAKILISSTYMVMFLIVIFLLFAFLILNHFISWADFFNVSEDKHKEVNTLFSIVVIAFLFQFVLNLINSILYAFQYSALSSFSIFISQLFSFLTILSLSFWAANLTLLIIGSVISVIPIFTTIGFSIYLFLYKIKEYSPGCGLIQLKSIKSIASLGIKFFIIQISTIVIYQTNSLIISKIFSSQDVVDYNIVEKYLGFLYFVFLIIATPIWSAVTDAYYKKDFVWINKIYKKMNLTWILFSLSNILLFFLGEFVYELWLGKEIVYNYKLSFIVLIFMLLRMQYVCSGYIINGIGKIKLQFYIMIIEMFFYIPLTIFCAFKWGLYGVALSSLFVSLLNVLWSNIQLKYILLKNV